MTEGAAEKESLLCDQWPKPVSHLCHHRPHKDKSWFLNSGPPSLPLLRLLPLLTQNHWVSPGRGGKMLDGLFVSADRGGSVSFDDDWLTDWRTDKRSVWLNMMLKWTGDTFDCRIWFDVHINVTFLLWFILDFSNFRNGLNTADMLHKYSGHRMLNPFLKVRTLCSAFLHSPKLLLWFHVMQCERVMADHFGTKTGKDCLLSKVTGLSLLFPRSYAGLPDWFE